MHSGREGKKERRRKRVSNAIDSGRRRIIARPSINRVSWVVYRRTVARGRPIWPSIPHRKFHRRARGALIRRRSSIERWKFGWLRDFFTSHQHWRTTCALSVVLASRKRDERATVEYGKSKIKVFLLFFGASTVARRRKFNSS